MNVNNLNEVIIAQPCSVISEHVHYENVYVRINNNTVFIFKQCSKGKLSNLMGVVLGNVSIEIKQEGSKNDN